MSNWEQSVQRAKSALMKTFEGRMDAAEASFEQVPPNGKGATGTLTDFAEEAGIELETLSEYRRVWSWLGHDSVPLHGIGSYSTAREAMGSDQWKTGKQFAAFLAKTSPPTWEPEGFEPYTFKSWTRDALRVYIGRQPSASTTVALQAKAEGREPTSDEQLAASASDHFEAGAEVAEGIENHHQSRKATQAVRAAKKTVEEHHDDLVMQAFHTDDIENPYREMEDILDRHNLPGIAAFQAKCLRETLAKVPEWKAQYGHLRRSHDAPTEGEVMENLLKEDRSEMDIAYANAAEGNTVADEAARFLAEGIER